MIVAGAKGFAKEVLEILKQRNEIQNLAFFDDVTKNIEPTLFNTFPILKNEIEVKNHFLNFGPSFTLGLGKPKLRLLLFDKLSSWGGTLISTISPSAQIGSFNVKIGIGCNILPLSVIANDCKIGKACIIYYNVNITHDCIIGDFVEISPGATILGNCKIGSFTQIGANATILPGIEIGENAIIGAGAVVTKNVLDNTIVAGIPAVKLRAND